MKKLIPLATLLAFALAFVGCGNGEETTEREVTLQDALDNGGMVNLDDYKLSKNSYTVSKTATITGNAKNKNFVIAEGADVTFDGTQNIGEVTVGNAGGSANKSAARAARSAGISITLKGEGVKIGKVFIHVDCSFASDNAGNSFGSVVVGENVKNLLLGGKTAVTALVSVGTSVAITVSAEVKIEKADETVIGSVQKNNPAITNITIDTISDSELKDLKSAFEASKKPEPELDDSNIIKTKEELAQCALNIIKEYYQFARDVEQQNSENNSRAVTQEDKTSLTAFLKEFFRFCTALRYDWDEYYDSENGEGIETVDMGILYKLFSGRGNEIAEDFHSEFNLDLKNIGVTEGLDAFIEAYNTALADVDEENLHDLPYDGELSRETMFGSNLAAANEFLNVINTYASVPKLRAVGKFDVNVSDANNFASGNADIEVKMEAHDINALIPKLFRAYNNTVEHTYIPASVNLPVTAVESSVAVAANTVFTKEQYGQFVQLCKGGSECDDFRDEPMEGETWEQYFEAMDEYYRSEEYMRKIKNYFSNATYPEPKGYSCNIETSVSATVASRGTVPGGIITVSLGGDCTLKQITMLLIVAPALCIDKSNYKANLRELETVYGITPTVTVTDSNGTKKYEGGIDDIIYVIDYIVENIGEIIQ